MRLVVFDLDHTLLTANSSFRFGLYLYRQKYFSFWKLLSCLSDYVRHKWLGMSIQTLHVRSFLRLFKGRMAAEIGLLVTKFLKEHLPSLLSAPVLRRLHEAQSRGDYLLILSSSPDFLVGEIAKFLQVDHWKGTAYQMGRGKFVALSQIIEGETKAQYLKELLHHLALPLSQLTVYSDSYLDLPILKMAGEAIGVRPDFQLRKICLQNSWEIL